jgi:trans-2,3-dihydro-3-hydroxyanthranilate isomerase
LDGEGIPVPGAAADDRRMKVSFVTLDVFTSRPFAGNQLLVVPDARGLSTPEMQAIAREINYSESTFVLPPDDPRHAYRQRTFVPLKEIPYAGHPTVGTAFAMDLFDKLPPGAAKITIEVGFGPLELELIREGGALKRVRMAQGAPAWEEPVSDPAFLARLEAGLALPTRALGGSLPVQAVSTGNRFLMVPVPDVAALAASAPDPGLLVALEEEQGALGTYLFTLHGGRVRTRCFAPGAGVPEDPATGSAAGPLGIYLALHGSLPGGVAEGRGHFFIDQGVEMGRPSELEVTVLVDGGRPTGVRVEGSAVVVMQGHLSFP